MAEYLDHSCTSGNPAQCSLQDTVHLVCRLVASSPVIDCNSCDPQLAKYFTVTLGGLTGSIFEACEGTHTLKWSSGCQWWDSTGLIYLLWYDSSNWIINASSPPSERYGQLRWTGPSDTCNPIYDYGSHSSCQDAPDATDCDDLGTTSCVVSSSVYNGPWTARAAPAPWPSFTQSVIDLADGDQDFYISWSIMQPATNVVISTEQSSYFSNTVPFPQGVDGSITWPEFESETAAAFQEWKNLVQSVFSVANGYGGQLTFNVVQKGIENFPDGSTKIDSSPGFTYALDPQVTPPAEESGLTHYPFTAYQAGVGDIRIGAVDRLAHLTGNPARTKRLREGLNRTLRIGSNEGDIYIDPYLKWRISASPETEDVNSYALSIKTVMAHEIGHSLGILHDEAKNTPDDFPEPPWPLMRGTLTNSASGSLVGTQPPLTPWRNFDYYFPEGLKASQWERRSLQEIYGYPPGE